MSVQVGDRLPSIQVHAGPGNAVDIHDALGTGKAILFAVPGAYTPGCSKTHLPGYIADAGKFADKGVTTIACVSVNDAFVMAAWGEAQGAGEAVKMLADPQAHFTKAIGLDVDVPGLGGTRSKRYAMIVDNGVVTHLQVEPDGFGLTCSLSPSLLEHL